MDEDFVNQQQRRRCRPRIRVVARDLLFELLHTALPPAIVVTDSMGSLFRSSGSVHPPFIVHHRSLVHELSHSGPCSLDFTRNAGAFRDVPFLHSRILDP